MVTKLLKYPLQIGCYMYMFIHNLVLCATVYDFLMEITLSLSPLYRAIFNFFFG